MTVETWDPCQVGFGPPPRLGNTSGGIDDEKGAMRWLASTAAEAVA